MTLTRALKCVLPAMSIVALSLCNVAKAEQTEYDYVVVGAGAAGLSAAYTLHQSNEDYTVLEKTNRTGGIAENGRKGSFHYAKGTEYLGEPHGALRNIVNELDIPMVEIPMPMDASYFDGKMHIGDDKIARLTAEKAGKQNFQHFLLMLKQAINGAPKEDWKKLDNITAKQWLNDNGISPFIQRRYNVMSRGLFGANLSDISALSLIPEAAFDYVGVTSYDDIFQPSNNSDSWTTVQGIASITDAIALELGDHIKYNSAVIEITRLGSKYKVIFNSNGKKSFIIANKVILATPSPVSEWIAKQVLTTRQKQLLSQIEYAQYITVALFSNTPIFNKAFDLAILDGDVVTDLYDATWVERHYKPTLKNVKEYIASAYLAPKGVSDKSLMTYSDDQIMSIIKTELSTIVPGIDTKITGFDIKRFMHAYPVMSPGSYGRLEELKNSFKGIYLAGDYMEYPTFEAAISSGADAAKKAMKHTVPK
ncbi:FAD-dependent oxidoreductase [Photobacterium chitinilyticum]|uniref:flavin monoamine oxidase family protein n=2 Tax=Photobacterium chitinilyticum TaxID=2485123 RepID=UPI003D0D78AF